MSIVIPEQATVAAASVTHPTTCAGWCKDRDYPAGHNHSERDTAHRSVELRLAAPGTSTDSAVLARAELFRLDENADTGDTCLWVSGETEFALSGPEVAIFIAQGRAFFDGLEVLRRQMGDAQ